MGGNKVKNVLVTGSNGYLGRFLVARLKSEGYTVRGFDLKEPEGDSPLDSFVQGDITSTSDIQAAVEGQDAVIHLVSLVRGREAASLQVFIDIMVKGTWLLAEAAAKAGLVRFVNVSSIVAVGLPSSGNQRHKEGDQLQMGGADNYYQMCKWIGEEVCRLYKRSGLLDIVNIRPGVIAGDGLNAGPSAPDAHVPHWFNYVDPGDVAQAAASALRSDSLEQTEYFIMADHPEAAYDISAAKRDLGYRPLTNWSEIRSPKSESGEGMHS